VLDRRQMTLVSITSLLHAFVSTVNHSEGDRLSETELTTPELSLKEQDNPIAVLPKILTLVP